MGRPRKVSDNKVAIARLRERHADKIEPLFLAMYRIAIGTDDGGQPLAEPKDQVNAAKVCASLLGTPRAATEKTDTAAKDIKAEKPTLSPAHKKVLDDILGESE